MDNLKEGDLVVLKDDRLSPLELRLGRIVRTYKEVELNIRVVDIKTSRPLLVNEFGTNFFSLTDMAANLPKRNWEDDEERPSNRQRLQDHRQRPQQ